MTDALETPTKANAAEPRFTLRPARLGVPEKHP